MIYVDASALLKIVKDDEDEPSAMRTYLEGLRSDLVSSTLLTVEMRRAMLRIRPDGLPKVDALLGRVRQLDVGGAVIETAGRLPDPLLRPLDAIHLATALLIREDVESLLTYDDRLADAARAHGLAVVSPS
ncbi:MAG: hypothetical protein AVDCRST_MAG66-1304 [uncultured Pseudonocardia sp.]|uniref:Ribonuclease VapC n=1 Tax=uncultured Pseudonocardia sp. TaxID=211455 RepID=A0A6J4NUP8_9PSEU|nr:MAG: hypothetical protein AVDCRST_MAG66-1304 [uncultured Pseudonocardia sp.]